MSIRKVVTLEQAEWSIVPVPAWVAPRDPDWEFTAPEGHAVACLLIDEQHDVATQTVSFRNVRKLLTLAAVQALGQVELEFDPAAQRLWLHELAVWRRDAAGGWTKRSLAQREHFLLRQREQQLEQQMLNGRASLVALLEDVRVGDAIELAWTLEPREPLPGLLFTTFYGFAWPMPVARIALTLHLASGHPVRWRLHAPPESVGPLEDNTDRQATWSMERPELFQPEPNVPGDHWACAVLEVSGWTTWPQVAAFAAALWADALAEGADTIALEAARLREGRDANGAAREAIRFVQDDLRYLAVDFGHGSGMLPNGAATVLRRRFGDCKDKAVLLTALLRALGLEAWPMLVAASWRSAVARVQPSVGAFSHAIVTFLLEGRRHFVDPTMLGQGGGLAEIIVPPYGFGLEIRSDGTGLIPIPKLPPAELSLVETFHLDHKGAEGAVEQELRATQWLGEEVRAALLRQGAAAFTKSRGEVLQKQFPALVPGDTTTTVEDDAPGHRVTWKARHGLPTWGRPGEKPPAAFAYGAHGLSLAIDIIEGPDQRRQPWALRFPMKVHHRVIVRGKKVRKCQPQRFESHGPGFRYTCTLTPRRRELTFDYHWETTADTIPPAQWPTYLRERTKAFERAGANVALQTRISPWALVGLIPVLLFLIGVAVAVNEATTGKGPGRLTVNEQRLLESDVRGAYEAMQRGDARTAEPLVERALPYYRGNFDLQLMRATIAIQLGHLDRAREALAAARKIDPNHPNPDRVEAGLQEKLGNFFAARSLLVKSRERLPDDFSVSFALARIEAQIGDAPAARRAYEELLARAPGHPDALLGYAFLLHKTGEVERANEVIRNAVANAPAPSAALESMHSRYLTATGKLAEAVEPARRAAELAPKQPELAHLYIMAVSRAGDQEQAFTLSAELIRRMPSNPIAAQTYATVAALAGKTAEARTAFQKWLRLAPQDPFAHSGYGYFLFRQGELSEARRILEKGTRDYPGDGLMWLNFGEVLEALGEKAAAAEANRKGTALIPPEQRATMQR